MQLDLKLLLCVLCLSLGDAPEVPHLVQESSLLLAELHGQAHERLGQLLLDLHEHSSKGCDWGMKAVVREYGIRCL